MKDLNLNSLSDISLLSLDPLSSEDIKDFEQNLPFIGLGQQQQQQQDENDAIGAKSRLGPKPQPGDSTQSLLHQSLGSLGGLGGLGSMGSGGLMTVDILLFSDRSNGSNNNNNNNNKRVTPPSSPMVRQQKPQRDWNALQMEELQSSIIAPSLLQPPTIHPQPPSPTPPIPPPSSTDFDYVERTERDVLLGRGDRSTKNPGNIRYLKVKDNMQQRYLAATKEGKTPISQQLLDAVHGWGGRFLQLDNQTRRWYEIDDKRARKKCSQALRDINTPQARLAKRQKYSQRKVN